MNAAFAQPKRPSRGAGLLLAHCAALDLRERRAPAPERLRDALGSELATMLVHALAGGRGVRYRDVA